MLRQVLNCNPPASVIEVSEMVGLCHLTRSPVLTEQWKHQKEIQVLSSIGLAQPDKDAISCPHEWAVEAVNWQSIDLPKVFQTLDSTVGVVRNCRIPE